MDTLYNWLLYNTGNAGNYYTILNTQRHEDSIELMARSSDFTVVNLLIQNAQNAGSAANQPASHRQEEPEKSFVFSNEQQVISYLAEGKTPESQQPDEGTGIRVFVVRPADEAGDITFPPDQL